MKTYRGYSRTQLIDILADFAVHTAIIDNRYGYGTKNTDKAAYIGLYNSYPMISKKHPAFSLTVMFDKMTDEITRAAEIASFALPAAETKGE